MKLRNEALYAEAARIAELKSQIPKYKQLADKHHVSVQTVRVLISNMVRAHKSTNIQIHVEPNQQ
jgi:orotate phosphoribosyltransferase-like protein